MPERPERRPPAEGVLWWTVRDVAALLQVDENTVYTWVKKEAIPSFKHFGHRRFLPEVVREWATQRIPDAQ